MTSCPTDRLSCDAHDLLEIAIMHGDRLIISSRSESGEIKRANVKPINTSSRHGVEYLQVADGATISEMPTAEFVEICSAAGEVLYRKESLEN